MPSYVITGASRGLGFEFVRQLSQNPENVVIGLVRNRAAADSKVQAQGLKNVHIVEVDYTDLPSLKKAAEKVKDLTGGGLDYLINNAAQVSYISSHKSLVDLYAILVLELKILSRDSNMEPNNSDDDFSTMEKDLRDSFDINVIGVIKTINAFLPLIKKGTVKKVITISSGMADLDLINDLEVDVSAPYTISKGAVNIAMAKYNAVFKKEGILFLSISPGVVATERASEVSEEEKQAFGALAAKFATYAPDFKRPLTPEESVKAVLSVVHKASVQAGDRWWLWLPIDKVNITMESVKVSVKLLPFKNVQEAIIAARKDWSDTIDFNTTHHTRDEISAMVPEENGLRHVKPSFYSTRLSHWLELIASTQGVSAWHVIEIPRYLAKELASLYLTWCSGRGLGDDTREELKSMFPKTTTTGVKIDDIFQGDKWFLRVDYCSAKDSEAGHSVVESLDDLIDRLYTSMRAIRAIADILEEDPHEKPKVFLIPFNTAMDRSRECRVFCPPHKNRVSAISQYRWTEPFTFRDAEPAQQEAQDIYSAACVIHSQILEHAERKTDVETRKSIQDDGFTFDVLKPASGDIQLVEINPFGAMSGCGSCLFQWIRDAKLLYGLKEQVELRFAV
ncbi:hypothetical protein TRV_02338 [Paecilomyces variotii No. 5]|uniref:Cell division cycle protein 123 n=1 Tax=Byssochlamys spectabilis (strain No. 5 / NBRC 109023) TaxID=1356009 RepID=V5FNR3_BYSSN|nr:hypothetical protein TRV_02338 [Paecilomyces variotii No. 5]